MRVGTLSALPSTSERSVVINVGTELLATLAVASAIEHAPMPLLLVNCDPSDASSAHFDRLSSEWGFDIIDAPRRTHGVTLDWLFAELDDDVVLLLDSDAEIRSAALIERMRAAFDVPKVFGAGFVEDTNWMTAGSGVAPRSCLMQERPWVPCVMLRTAHVRAAMATGLSFEIRTIYNDFMWSDRIARALATRFQNGRVPRSRVVRRLPAPVRSRLAMMTFPHLAGLRRSFYGQRPNYVYCDTAADVYQWCKYDSGWVFAGGPNALRTRDDVVHYKGATRRRLGYGSPGFTEMENLEQVIAGRLADSYALDWAECVERAEGLGDGR